MARTARRRRTSTTSAAPATPAAPDPVAEAVCDRLRTSINKELSYSTTAPHQMQGYSMAGVWKTVTVDADSVFTFRGARVGARGKILFELTPLDPFYGDTEYEKVELPEDKIFTALPELEGQAMDALGFNVVEHNVSSSDATFANARAWFAEKMRKEAYEAAKAEEQAKEQSLQDRYAGNPNFGAW